MTVRSDAPFYWPLRGSIALQNGGGTPTFTRATAKWVFNDEGKLIKLPSGAIEMRGYRCVRNLLGLTYKSDDLTAWQVSGTFSSTFGAATDPWGGNSCTTLAWSGANLGGPYTNNNSNVSIGETVVFSLYMRSDAPGTITIMSSGAGGEGETLCNVTASWQLFQVPAYIKSSNGGMWIRRRNTGQLNKVYVTRCGYENVTAQSDKTASDCPSIGVLPAPYHGAGVDGVKYFATTKSGAAIPESSLIGAWLNPNSTTNDLLYCRDLTNAAWVKTNVTAALNQTGIDGQANASSLLTATAADATALQSITAASAAGCSGYFVRRAAGTGGIYFTRDGGTNWIDITNLINGSTPTLVKIENTSVLNPQVGFKLATSGDQIHVDAGINHLGTELANPILTTSATVTVNAETLTAPTASNFSDTAGTIIATVERGNWANNNGVVVGKAGSGLATSASNSGVQALDGTNTVNGPAGSTATRRTIGMKWSGSSMKTFAGGNFGAPGSYDGSFNLTTIAIMPQANGYIRDVAIWPTELSDADMLAAASEQSDFSASVSFAAAAYANVIHSVSASMPINIDVTGYTSVIHSVSAAMAIDFNAAMRANVIHSVSANIGVAFDADFEAKWIIPSLKIAGSYGPPVIQGTYGPTT